MVNPDKIISIDISSKKVEVGIISDKLELESETDRISISSILQKILTPSLNTISNLFKFNKWLLLRKL